MDVTLLATCITCPGANALKTAAIRNGHHVIMETIKHSDSRTKKSDELGIGLPVLVSFDGQYSDDGVHWVTSHAWGDLDANTNIT